MFINKITQFVILLVFLGSSFLFSNEYYLSKIKVTGLKRTVYSTVLKIADIKTGIVVNENSPEEIRQDLLASGIFQNEIKVDLIPVSDTTANINIELRDRWTLIPLPVGFVSSDSWLAGAVFIESNLAGLNQTLVAGAFTGSEYFQGFGAWSNPSFFGSKYSFGLSASYYFGLIEHLDISGENILASFDKSEISSRIRFGRSLPLGFSVEGSSGIKSLKSEEATGYLGTDSEYLLYWENGFTLRYEDLIYKSFFNEGWSLKLTTDVSVILNGKGYELGIEFNLSRNFILADRHLLRAEISAAWQNSSDTNSLYIGGTEGSRALPSGDVAVRYYSSGVVSFEPVIFKPKWGIFTLPVYYEAGLYRPLHTTKENVWHGPGIGFRFYVDKVAIPALGADFTWDLQNGGFKVAVSIGGSGGGE